MLAKNDQSGSSPKARLSYRMNEFAEATGIAVSTLYRDRQRGLLKTVKVGGMTLVLVEDGQAYIRGSAA